MSKLEEKIQTDAEIDSVKDILLSGKTLQTSDVEKAMEQEDKKEKEEEKKEEDKEEDTKDKKDSKKEEEVEKALPQQAISTEPVIQLTRTQLQNIITVAVDYALAKNQEHTDLRTAEVAKSIESFETIVSEKMKTLEEGISKIAKTGVGRIGIVDESDTKTSDVEKALNQGGQPMYVDPSHLNNVCRQYPSTVATEIRRAVKSGNFSTLGDKAPTIKAQLTQGKA